MQPFVNQAQQVLGQYYLHHNWGNLICASLVVEAAAHFIAHFAAGIFCQMRAPFSSGAWMEKSRDQFTEAGINVIDGAFFAFGALTPAGSVIVPIAMAMSDFGADDEEGFSERYYLGAIGKVFVLVALGNRMVEPLADGLVSGTTGRIKTLLDLSDKVTYIMMTGLIAGVGLYATGIGSLPLSAMFAVKVL